ncbi:SusD/RagB family nutrient-binding outer membrane lipoprotein [Sinomicrobium sp. FJxs]|uniref:SusD/RagB family nutrient-binding outer membrane lipoprotein n=2 Tax=Sinomicrobium weinanense TaxID=2842200 RepID=A0A926JPK2_9FLAO|nr:SusD/RagB family nutrient-binding outer membrane lipoprotein [Sinomicrobium weinanense]
MMSSGCTKDFDELNTDPKGLTVDALDASNIGKLFSQTNYTVMSHSPVGTTPSIFQVTDALFPDYYAQYFATTQPRFPSDRHTIVGGWNDSAWRSTFEQSAPALRLLVEKTEELGFTKENAIAKVWEVFQFHRLTDYYGPVPYSEFGNGETSVAYDSQESIYKSFFPILDEAIAELQNGGTSIFGAEDLIYGGDISKWYKFANSLRLRLAMRIRFVEPALARAEAEKAITAGVIEDVADNAFVTTNPSTPNAYNVITAWGEFRMSASMESVLKGYDDPRTPKMYSPATNGDSPGDDDDFPYEGMLNGQSIAALEDGDLDFNNNTSDMAPEFMNDPSTPIAVLRAAEVYFLRAEGALIGWNMGGGTAKDYYEAGINASLEEWGTSNSDYATSTAVPAAVATNIPAMTDIPILFDETDPEKALEQIITQKWISLYPESREAWAELRRTGYPKLYSRLNSENTEVGVDDIMRRLTYPPIEFTTNGEAVEAAISSPELGGEKNGSTRLWWDKR